LQKTVDKTVEKWRFSEVDHSSALNNFGGFLNVPNYPNWSAFAALKADMIAFKFVFLALAVLSLALESD
jgi:hypothetical protein